MEQVEVRLAMSNLAGEEHLQISWTGYLVVPGLVVCKTPKWVDGCWLPSYRKWQIVHISSGWRVGGNLLDFQSRALAGAMARRLVGLADWTLSVNELLAVEGLRERVEEVIGG